MSRYAWMLAAALSTGACSIVTPDAYLDAEARERDAGDDGGPNTSRDASNDRNVVDAGTDAEPPTTDAGMVLADSCDGPDPIVLPPGLRPFLVTTAGLRNDFDRRRGLQCTGEDAPGADGFFAIDVQADEKWHFRITAEDPESNPSIFLLDSTCRADQCQPRFGQDACGTFADEHFTIVATHAGRWYLGIDDRAPGEHSYRLNPIRTTCGNDVLEHGEACDGPDNCDSQCRWRLDNGAADIEPNDDWTVANVLTLPRDGGETFVIGQIGTTCGADIYAVDVAAGASLEVTLLDRDGSPCGVPTCTSDEDAGVSECPTQVPIAIELLAANGATILGEGSVRAGSTCRSITQDDAFARNLAASGVYYLRLTSPVGLGLFDYRLHVRIVPP